MEAIILAGGFGTRLRPLTNTRPKPLVPIGNVPLVEYIIAKMPHKIVKKVILAVSYMKEEMERYFEEHEHPFEIVCVREEEPLGTGGAIKNVERELGDQFLVFNGDVISSVDVRKMRDYHKEKGGIGTLALWEVDDPTAFGVVGLNEKGRITAFQEKPKKEEAVSNLINAGCYILESEILDYIPSGKVVSVEREVFSSSDVLDKGLYGFRFSGYFEDAGTPEKLLKAQKVIFRTHMNEDYLNIKNKKVKIIGENSQLDVETKLFRPVVIGEGCVLRRCIVGPWLSLGSDVSVGSYTRIENSILLNNIKIGKKAYIRNSIVGENVIIEDEVVVEGEVVADGEHLR